MHEDSSESDGARNGPVDGERASESGEVAGTSDPAEAPPASAEEGDPLAQARAELARLKDALLRTAADFDNFRKRSRRELEEARRNGREDLLRALLPVFDNLERAMQSAQTSSDVKAMADGLAMVQRQFLDAIGREGIARLRTVGSAFDPGVHEAIQQVESDEHAPGTIIAEVQPGYMQGERLVRAAMVVVARPKRTDEGPEGSSNAN
jgi:molecular chaperone GrpE